MTDDFAHEREQRIRAQGENTVLGKAAQTLMLESIKSKYSYNFTWLSRPIIQYPQDIVAFQEIVWRVKPDLIIETGIAHGGSLILSASTLALLEYEEAVASGTVLDPRNPRRRVVGVDVDIRKHNKEAVEAHCMAGRITMIQGSSVAPDVVSRVRSFARDYSKVLVCLDSNHTHDHVLAELEAYAPLVSVGSYCMVFDTVIENLPKELYPDRSWGPGDNPMSAADEYLKALAREPRNGVDERPLKFEIDELVDSQLLLSVAPRGYLHRKA